MNSLMVYLTLPRNERWPVIMMSGMIALTGLGLRLFGFKSVYSILQRLSHVPSGTKQKDISPDRVRVWKRYLKRLGHGSCLSRSMVIWWALRRRGFDTDLRIGTRKINQQFQAHAWLEYQGRVLNAGQRVLKRYTVFDHSFTEKETP